MMVLVGRTTMRLLLTVACALVAGLAQVQAADLEWEVENPFRFFKVGSSFVIHEQAFDAVRGDRESPIPNDIVWRTERRLNDPDCSNKSTPDACAKTARKGYQQSRLGWAARTHSAVCYDSEKRPRGYMGQRARGLRPARSPHHQHQACQGAH